MLPAPLHIRKNGITIGKRYSICRFKSALAYNLMYHNKNSEMFFNEKTNETKQQLWGTLKLENKFKCCALQISVWLKRKKELCISISLRKQIRIMLV